MRVRDAISSIALRFGLRSPTETERNEADQHIRNAGALNRERRLAEGHKELTLAAQVYGSERAFLYLCTEAFMYAFKVAGTNLQAQLEDLNRGRY